MKKILVLFIIIIMFMFGLVIGNTDSSYSRIFESAKDEFEENIKLPDNEYNPKTLKPEEKAINKIANFVNKIINKISDKLS